MRPQGELRLALAAALVDGGGTTRDLAARIVAGRVACMQTLDAMARAGQVAKRYVRVPGVCRPVPYYERPTPPDNDDAGELDTLIGAWVRSAQQPEGRDM